MEGQGEKLEYLNFYPCFDEAHIRNGATVRLGDKSKQYKEGDYVDITKGWNPLYRNFVCEAEITYVTVGKLKDLVLPEDLHWYETILSLIYHGIIDGTATVTIIHYKCM